MSASHSFAATETKMADTDTVLSWVHFGDLHITRAGEQNYRDFLALIDKANHQLGARVSFALLPGDNADDGAEAQFRLVRDAIANLSIPLHILPGDHDFHTRSLAPFYEILAAERLPKSVPGGGHRCLFLDIVSAGAGGPDFRLDDAQLDWMASELEQAETVGQRALVFMHACPADLRAGGERLGALLRRHRVLCVDTGHTHYNEIANDGRTVFMATRSTGQIEEGPVGYSVSAVDAGVVSWRFAPLDSKGPLVLITRPSDHRLIVDPGAPDQVVRETLTVRAKIWATLSARHAFARVDGGDPIALAPDLLDPSLWQARQDVRTLSEGRHTFTAEAHDIAGNIGHDAITVSVARNGRYTPPTRSRDGGDCNAICAWPEKGILGTQLGPNKNGRKW
jgi:3',5'-cyclic-AMP phosphodiesterase